MQLKFLLTIFFFSSSLLLCFNQARAQSWRSLNGPVESNVQDIIIKNDTMYVAAFDPGGFFKKGIHSDQWLYSEIVEGEGVLRRSVENLLSININPDGTYYAGGNGIVNLEDEQGYNQLFYSKNHGKTWKEIRNGIEYCYEVYDIFVSDTSSLFLGCLNGTYAFNKEKLEFRQVNSSNIVATFFQKNDTLLAGTNEGILSSVDYGNTWTNIGPDTLGVYSITFNGNQIFVGTKQGLYQTSNLNLPWTYVEEIPATPINTLLQFLDISIIGTDSGVYSISSSGLDVQPVFPELKDQQINTIIGFEETIYIGSETGLYSCNLEQNICLKEGVPNSRIRTMNSQNDDTLWAGTSQSIHRYFVNQDQWDTSSVPIEDARNIVPVNSDSFLTISNRYFLSCSFEHSTCDSTRFSGSGTTLFDLKQNTAGDLFIASKERVFKSTDKGGNWETIYTNPDNSNFNLFTFSDSLLFINGSGLIKYSLYTDTYKTLDNEVSIITGDGTMYATVNGIQKSTDFGETWTTVLRNSDITNAGLGGLKFLLFDEENKTLYGISPEGGVFVSENEGEWGINEEMHPVYIESAGIGPDGTLYLGSAHGGVFKNTEPLDPPITISNEEEHNTNVPNKFTLHQNYPNPFNPSTTVSFELNEPQEVDIIIFNTFGQKVQAYHLGQKNAGFHEQRINLNDQSSGVYFLQVKAGAQRAEVMKISFIK